MSEYTFLWSNTHQLFYMLGNIDSYCRYSHIPFNRAEKVFQVSHGSRMSCYNGSADLERYVEEGKQFLDRAFAEQYLKNAREQCNNHQSFFKWLADTDFSQSTDLDLRKCWQGLIDNYSHSVAYFRSTQDEPSRAIVETVTKILSSEEANILLLSSKLDAINEEEIVFEELLKSGCTREGARSHIQKFPWLFQNSLSIEETVDELEQRTRGHISRDIKAEKKNLEEQQQIILAQHPELIANVEILQELALLRPQVKTCWAATGFFATPILEEISRRKNIDLKTLTFFYRSEDVGILLGDGRVLSEEEIAQRQLCTAYLWESGELRSAVGVEAEEMEKAILGNAETLTEIKEIRGTPARPGRVTGVVHILEVNDPEATRQFRDSFTGGVLVTSMTQPNVVDIARRASAIITDEGGMLCHAAIISREFGIPCVVGTHHATTTLKDGETVEVDADKGIIRRI